MKMSKPDAPVNMSLANALVIAVWYVPVLLTFTVLMLASIPLLSFMTRFWPDTVLNFVHRCETWLIDKDAEIDEAIKRLRKKK